MQNAGTVRCHEAVTKLPGSYDIVINIQGDEPLMEPQVIDEVVRALQDTPEAVYRWGQGCNMHTGLAPACMSCRHACTAACCIAPCA